MTPSVQKKIDEILELAKSRQNIPTTKKSIKPRNPEDGLSKVIRSKEDGEDFMRQLAAIGTHLT